MLPIAFDTTVSSRATTGVGVYARELFNALRARGLDVREWQRPLAASGSRVSRVVNGIRLASWYGPHLRRLATREQIAVYHATTSLGPIALRQPVVFTLHDATTLSMPIHDSLPDRLFQRVFSVAAARRADAVLAPTRTAADAIAATYGIPVDRVRIVPLGVSPAFRHVQASAVAAVRMRYALWAPFILFAGAEPPRKNLTRLVEAFAMLGAEFDEVELIRVGPPLPRDVRADACAARLGLGRRVRNIGSVARDDLPAIYAAASCLAYTSLCEGFGFPIVEAMAVGTPVVTSNCSSMPEVAADAAILVDPLSATSIAAGLHAALSDGALVAELRVRGLRRSRSFDWAVTAELTEQVYRDVCGR